MCDVALGLCERRKRTSHAIAQSVPAEKHAGSAPEYGTVDEAIVVSVRHLIVALPVSLASSSTILLQWSSVAAAGRVVVTVLDPATNGVANSRVVLATRLHHGCDESVSIHRRVLREW